MLKTRVIPCLLLKGESLVKSIQFKSYQYIGDAINTVRIFNQMQVDELIFLDIMATKEKRSPSLALLRNLADECFMPFTYGGGVTSCDQIRDILAIGVEKVSLNSKAFENPGFVKEASRYFGSQSIVVSIDVGKTFWGQYRVVLRGSEVTGVHPVVFARQMEEMGAGEILLTSIRQEGTWDGYDLPLLAEISSAVRVPVVAHGGAGSTEDFRKGVAQGKASAVAAGSLFLFQGKGLGILINYPDRDELQSVLG
jgi:cyclase